MSLIQTESDRQGTCPYRSKGGAFEFRCRLSEGHAGKHITEPQAPVSLDLRVDLTPWVEAEVNAEMARRAEDRE